MKINLPVTDREVVLGDNQMIVSETDLKGVITNANRAFVEISGFSEQELLGANHNIVRHPDMPAAAFKDLWDTIKQGRPWVGIVKNRCKNGDFYWVEANVTPIREGNVVTGYMSVRYKPSREKIERAARLYRDMNAGKAPGRPLSERLRAYANRGLGTRVAEIVVLSFLIALTAGLAGLAGNLPFLLVALGAGSAILLTFGLNLAASVARPLEQAASCLNGMAQGDYKQPVDIGGSGQTGQLLQAVKSAQIRLGVNLSETHRIADEALRVRNALDNVSTGVMIAGKDRKIVYANPAAQKTMKSVEAAMRARIPGFDADKLLGSGIDRFHEAPERHASLLDTLTGEHVSELALGDRRIRETVNPVFDGQGHRIGSVAEWTDMTEELAMREKERAMAAENARIRIALDNVSTGVTIADRRRNIVYLNASVRKLLKAAEADIRKQLPHFDADKLLGANIDAFHKNPEHQIRLLDSLDRPYAAEIRIGGRHLRVIANPVIDERGERLGSVAEWTDRTLQVAMQSEVAGIVEAAAAGDFSRRAALEGKEGFFEQLAQAVNRLLDVSEQGLIDVAQVLAALARGDLSARVSGDYQGLFDTMKNDANDAAGNLSDIVRQIKEATDSINTAAKEIAMGNSDLSQRTEEQASSLEETASSMEELSSTVRQNADNARQADRMATAASEVALKGGAVVQQVVGTMFAINESARKIVDIIGTIDGIAFQTNILALNAAVEAARAGEQGRGFAVVAGEVRNLAQRSATAAKEIKALIGDSVEKAEAGARLVDEAGRTMQEIVQAVKRVTDIMAEISSASLEQSSGIEQVNRAIAQIDDVTQQNAALVEQAAAAAESLQEQAVMLAESVSRFNLEADSIAVAPPRRSASARAPLSTPRKPAQTGAVPVMADQDEWSEF